MKRRKRAVRKGAKTRPEDHREAYKPAEPVERAVTKEGYIVGSYSVTREILESIAIAFILAFLFKAFEAEAFVIPTGSMAPTLMGRHKDFECPECGFRYKVGASCEMNEQNGRKVGVDVMRGVCPNCHHVAHIGPDDAAEPSYGGDRILVTKFPYEYRDPRRFEVSVFRYPRGARKNYIKRIVGLPNETLRIANGNLYVAPPESEGDPDAEFQIQRKPPRQLRAMLQTVHDNDEYTPELREKSLPKRWASDDAAWTTDDDRRFATDGSSPEARLCYAHRIPTTDEWDAIRSGDTSIGSQIPPQLITDYAFYNSHQTNRYGDEQAGRLLTDEEIYTPMDRQLGLNWVRDIGVECEVTVQSQAGVVRFELVKGGRPFVCSIDVASGKARLSIPSRPSFGTPSGETAMRGPGVYNMLFTNVDDELRLWVNDDLVEFNEPTTYVEEESLAPTVEDLSPVRIGSDGAKIEVDRLRVLRDIHYIATSSRAYSRSGSQDLAEWRMEGIYRDSNGAVQSIPNKFYEGIPFKPLNEHEVRDVLSNPGFFDFFNHGRRVEFEIGSDQFFACGDNSGASSDSRIWGAFDRKFLVGKAIAVYWPHGWMIPGVNLPYVPNVGGMRLIR